MNFSVEEELDSLKAEVALLQREKTIREENGLFFYTPHAKQYKFHSVGHITGRHCRTGNRGGKTVCGAAEDIAYCIGGRTWARRSFEVKNGKGETVITHEGGFNHPLVRHGIPDFPVKGLLLVHDWDKSAEIFTNMEGSYDRWGALMKILPKKNLVDVLKNKQGNVDRIVIQRDPEFGGGQSMIYIDTYKAFVNSPLSAESSSWDFIHVDEPIPEEMFVAHKRGLVDRNGKFWINCTPLEYPWIAEEFTPEKKAGKKPSIEEGVEWNKGSSISRFAISWGIADNPHNTKEAIEEFLASVPAESLACRRDGTPKESSGLIYSDFVYDEHVLSSLPEGWEDFDLPPKDFTTYVFWDYHIRLPQAVLFIAVSPDGTVYVFDELFSETGIGANAELIHARLRERNLGDNLIDPLALVKGPRDETTVVEDLLGFDLFFQPASKDKRRGILALQNRLKERSPKGAPSIFFSPYLKETLREIERYSYKYGTNEPKDENDHMMENLYRAIIHPVAYRASEDLDSARREVLHKTKVGLSFSAIR